MSPVFLAVANTQVSFRLALTERNLIISDAMGSDDSLNVMISTDCGQSWTRVRAFTAASALTNTLTEYSVDLSAFSGQSCRVAFFGTEGTIDNINDFDVHLDDVKVDVISGVEHVQTTSLVVYPNPARTHFTVVSPGLSGVSGIALYSVAGKRQTITVVNAGNDSVRVETAHLAPGIYLLQVPVGHTVQVKRITILP
jgi:hypothetical protein